ncbi:PTS sugar transporter subunit IIA [Brachybacterium sp. EF45031]|uniref:PTS fructose transporter subunit IIABC n=1 Tax=Brachybacterium sillae TaxID=2810536 RepID=UPI00217D700A|nr:fructose-specific PTS transporter subunit EIIC [Brachybacterium sillae]MCS6710747.1 PTS sugar transporter subunit IIA [Brachybacterium sillae]
MSDLLTPQLVELDVSPGSDTSAVIAAMAALIGASGRADAAGLERAMLDREAQMPTGMPGGFAIPHCKADAVREPSLGFLRLAEPVDFGGPDGPADIIIGICAPDGAASTHLDLLARLARSLVRPEFLAALRGAASREEVARLVMEAVEPEGGASGSVAASSDAAPAAAAPAAEADRAAITAPAPTGSAPRATEATPAPDRTDTTVPTADSSRTILAITSCPTGIAHTYMAAEALENAGRAKGVTVLVEPQGSGGFTPFTPEQIREADALIIAADVNITGRERFAGLPVVESSVKRPISDGPTLIDEALAAIDDPRATRVSGTADAAAATSASETRPSWPRRIQAAVMTGVSYMIPFVAAGGLLIALGFLLGGYDVAFVANQVALENSLWQLPGQVAYDANGVETLTEKSGLPLYLGAVLVALGGAGMGFLVAALSGYIAFGLAGRPGIAPGFIGGAISVMVGAGFIGGLVTGILAGLIAAALAGLKPPRWLAGLMPVVIIPLVTTLVVGAAMLMVLGRPLAALMTGLQESLQGMSGSSAILLGVILGLMMCFDLGGPVNKAAYLFATAGLSQGTEASFQIMAAVMAAGMVPPLAMALSTVVRKHLYTPVERENGATAWLLGAAFISEGAIPFAAADPLRVIPSMMAGGAVTGALSMAMGVGSQAPHGGIFVAFAISPILGYVVAIVVGTLVAATLVTVLKELRLHRQQAQLATAGDGAAGQAAHSSAGGATA